MVSVNLRINGKDVSKEVEARRLLVDFIRHDLGLTGTHVGCETSQCGACLVRVNGKVVKACTMLTVEAEGTEIVTIEGMAPEGDLHPIQKAFRDHHGLQCGFCTPGMIMSAAALLEENPKPTDHEIRHWLEGNICRCTGYQNIVKSIRAASGQAVDIDSVEPAAR